MSRVDLTICVPGIRTQNWDRLIESIIPNIGRYSWEVIFVGPTAPMEKLSPKVRFISDWGAPARCTQIAALNAQGSFLTWASDDGIFIDNGLEEALHLYHTDQANYSDMICMRYTEGVNFSGTPQPDDYWRAHHHADQRLPGIPDTYRIAPLGLMYTDLFYKLGGFDCRFEHINMCTHALAFSAQDNGGKVLLSPTQVMRCNWNPNQGDHVPVMEAYHQNDLPLFNKIYGTKEEVLSSNIYNYIDSPSRWVRRFK